MSRQLQFSPFGVGGLAGEVKLFVCYGYICGGDSNGQTTPPRSVCDGHLGNEGGFVGVVEVVKIAGWSSYVRW